MNKRVIIITLAYTLAFGVMAASAFFFYRTEASHYGEEVSQLESVVFTAGLFLYPIGLILGAMIMFVFYRRKRLHG